MTRSHWEDEEWEGCLGYLRKCWWWPLLGFQASILPRIWGQVILTCVCCVVAVTLHCSVDGTAHELTGIVLGPLHATHDLMESNSHHTVKASCSASGSSLAQIATQRGRPV